MDHVTRRGGAVLESLDERTQAELFVSSIAFVQRHPCRQDGHDFESIGAQPVQHAVPPIDQLAQLPLPIFRYDTAELRMILQPIDSTNQIFDDARSLVRGVALRQPRL